MKYLVLFVITFVAVMVYLVFGNSEGGVSGLKSSSIYSQKQSIIKVGVVEFIDLEKKILVMSINNQYKIDGEILHIKIYFNDVTKIDKIRSIERSGVLMFEEIKSGNIAELEIGKPIKISFTSRDGSFKANKIWYGSDFF